MQIAPRTAKPAMESQANSDLDAENRQCRIMSFAAQESAWRMFHEMGNQETGFEEVGRIGPDRSAYRK